MYISGKQTSAHARVCLQDLQVSRKIFPVILMKCRLIKKTFHIYKNACFYLFASLNDAVT